MAKSILAELTKDKICAFAVLVGILNFTLVLVAIYPHVGDTVKVLSSSATAQAATRTVPEAK